MMRTPEQAALEYYRKDLDSAPEETRWLFEDALADLADLLRQRDAEWRQVGNARFDQLCAALQWALEMMEMHEHRLINLGDPPALVRGETHQAATEKARTTLVSAGKMPFTAAKATPAEEQQPPREWVGDFNAEGKLRVRPLAPGEQKVEVELAPEEGHDAEP